MVTGDNDLLIVDSIITGVAVCGGGVYSCI